MKSIEETHPSYCKYIKEELLYPNKPTTSREMNKALQENTVDKAVLMDAIRKVRDRFSPAQSEDWDFVYELKKELGLDK